MKKKMKGMIDRIKESNAEYFAADPAKKRVMIAHDVLAALDAEELVAQQDKYVVARDCDEKTPETRDPLSYTPDEVSFKDIIAGLPACSVCAKGAIFMCAVARQNAVQVGAVGADPGASTFRGENLSKLLGGVFSADQLHLIEVEFERDDVEHNWFKTGTRIVPVMPRLTTAQERLRAIMANIINHGGTFVPGDDAPVAHPSTSAASATT